MPSDPIVISADSRSSLPLSNIFVINGSLRSKKANAFFSGFGKNKKIAIFSSPDGGAFKFEEGELLTTSTILIEIFGDVVIVKDAKDQKFEVYMNNIIRPSEG